MNDRVARAKLAGHGGPLPEDMDGAAPMFIYDWLAWRWRDTADEDGLAHPLPVAVAPSERVPSPVGNGPMGLDAYCTVTDVGEPCAIEPHTRFRRGELEKERPGC